MNLRVIKKENGFSFVDFILLTLIIFCSIFIFFIINGNNKVAENSNVKTEEFDTSSQWKNSIKETENIPTQSLNVSWNTYNVENIDTNINTDNSSDSYKKYFYNQLNMGSKNVYKQILNNIDALKSGDKEINFSDDSVDVDKNFQSAWDALMMDNPEIFFVNTNNITLETRTDRKIWESKLKYSYKLMPKQGKKYYLDAWNNEEELEKSIKGLNEKVNGILSGASGSRFDKVKYIHDYLVDNVEYDKNDRINNGNLYGALIEGSAVCEGYSKAFQYLLNLLDIPNILVYGDGINSNNEKEYHSWNYVQMEDGKWYAVDTTWDDPIIVGNGKITDKIKHEYFLKGSDSFFDKHKENSDVSGTEQNFKYIEISKTDYNN